jgi:hypothetical protein
MTRHRPAAGLGIALLALVGLRLEADGVAGPAARRRTERSMTNGPR